MASFEEDLKYCSTILKIRSMMQDESILKNPNIKKVSQNILSYGILTEFPEHEIIGYIEHRKEHLGGSQHWFAPDILVSFNRHFDITVCDGKKLNVIAIDDYEITKEWYFQQSLLYTDLELRAIMVHKTLLSTKSDLEYFQLKLNYIDRIMDGL